MTDAALAPSNELADGLRVALVVDGHEVPLTDFVTRVLAGGVLGMVGTLKGVPARPRTVELTVEQG
ncbi:MAG: hypothetical protein M5U14_04335 [Acidimicrobiia bacterium]|nr:hypothetical protein [Acidimicrobiia bacterium]